MHNILTNTSSPARGVAIDWVTTLLVYLKSHLYCAMVLILAPHNQYFHSEITDIAGRLFGKWAISLVKGVSTDHRQKPGSQTEPPITDRTLDHKGLRA